MHGGQGARTAAGLGRRRARGRRGERQGSQGEEANRGSAWRHDGVGSEAGAAALLLPGNRSVRLCATAFRSPLACRSLRMPPAAGSAAGATRVPATRMGGPVSNSVPCSQGGGREPRRGAARRQRECEIKGQSSPLRARSPAAPTIRHCSAESAGSATWKGKGRSRSRGAGRAGKGWGENRLARDGPKGDERSKCVAHCTPVPSRTSEPGAAIGRAATTGATTPTTGTSWVAWASWRPAGGVRGGGE